MSFDWTLRVDTLLSLTIGLISAGAIWGALRSDLKTVIADVRLLKEAQAAVTSMLIDIARQDQQLKDYDRRLSKLEDT